MASIRSFRQGSLLVVLLLAGSLPRGWSKELPAEVTGLVYLPGGTVVLSANRDGYLREHRPDGKNHRRGVLAHAGGVFGLALSDSGKWLATVGEDRLVRLWDVARLKEVRSFRGHTDRVVGVAISPDGKWIASGGYDRKVRIWNLATGDLRHQLEGHDFRVTSLAFSSDGKTLVSGGIVQVSFPGVSGPTMGDQLCSWDVERGALRQRLGIRGHRIQFSPDGSLLAAGGLYLDRGKGGVVVGGIPIDGGSRISLLGWKSQATRLVINEYDTMPSLSPDGRLLATGRGSRLHYGGLITRESVTRGIHLWEVATGKQVMHVPVPRDEAIVLAVAPDGRSIASGSSGNTVKFHPLAPPGWSPSGRGNRALLEKSLAHLSGTDSALAYRAIWDLSSGGDEAVGLVARLVKPVPILPPDRLRRLLDDLDSDTFATRQQAQKELGEHGPTIEGDLERVLEGKPSLEVRRRVLELLAPLRRGDEAGDRRDGRAVTVLERIGTVAAITALEALSKGASGARLTRDAQGALNRLRTREGRKVP